MDQANHPNKEWYVLHTYSGYENKVKENILMRAESMDMADFIFNVAVPEEEVTEVTEEETKTKVQKTFPGYVLVEMVMTDQSWFIVRNTPGVTGFVGSHGAGSKPAPLLPEEVEMILGSGKGTRTKEAFQAAVGERVEIIDGAFSGMEGVIEEIASETEKLKVVIEMFGRETVAELDFTQVKKLDL